MTKRNQDQPPATKAAEPGQEQASKPKELATTGEGHVQWSKYIKLQTTAKQLEKALWNAGILTFDDLNTKPQVAIGALQAAYGLDVATLRETVRKELKND